MQRRNTKQRQLVLNAVLDRCDHPTAEQIYQDVRAQNPHVSRGTVYRNLAVLAQNGEILEVETPTSNRYDLRKQPHPHAQCTRCDTVIDVPVEYQSDLDQQVADATGFSIQGHHTVFLGLCAQCAQAAATQKSES